MRRDLRLPDEGLEWWLFMLILVCYLSLIEWLAPVGPPECIFPVEQLVSAMIWVVSESGKRIAREGRQSG